MTQTGLSRYTPHALVGAAVFGFMHVADEMAGDWDAGAPGGSLGDSTAAAIALGVFALVGMWALWWLLTERPWGYVIAALFGLQFLVTGGTHFVDTAEMTTFRWVVVALQVAFAAAVLVLGANGTWAAKPWRRAGAAAG